MNPVWTVRRSSSDVKIAGLCAGVARHWNVDPVLVRVGWALLALSGGVGVVLYLAGWLLIPTDARDKAPIEDLLGSQARRLPKAATIALIVLACLVVLAAAKSIVPFSIVPALVIAVIWYFGVYKPRHVRNTTPPAPGIPPATPLHQPPGDPVPQFLPYPGPPTPFTEAVSAWQQRIQQRTGAAPRFAPMVQDPGVVQDPPAAPQPPAPSDLDQRRAYLAAPDPVGLYGPAPVVTAPVPVPAPDRRPARRLRLVALVTMALSLSALGVVEATGAHLAPVVWIATPLLVLALALIAATWIGRARGLLPLGLLLAVALLVATAVRTPPEIPAPLASAFSSSHAYTALAAVPAAGDRLDVGVLRVDLRGLDVDRDTVYAAHVDLGRVEVIVPPGARVAVDYRTELGEVLVQGQKVAGGTELRGSVPPAAGTAGPTLTLQLSTELGRIEVRR